MIKIIHFRFFFAFFSHRSTIFRHSTIQIKYPHLSRDKYKITRTTRVILLKERILYHPQRILQRTGVENLYPTHSTPFHRAAFLRN